MENISEKPKRGRPRLMHPAIEALARKMGDKGGARSMNNRHYETRAMRVLVLHKPLAADDPLCWLSDPQREAQGERAGYRQTIVSELGRIPDDDDLRAVALRICELKPKTREAITLIRRFRLGEITPTPEQLESEIVRTLDDFLRRYPSTSWAEVLAALDRCREYVQAAALSNSMEGASSIEPHV